MRNPVPLLHDFLHDTARRLPEKVALVAQKRRVTYAEIEASANALAHALAARGVSRGDRVVIFAENTVETVVAFWAVLAAGAVVSIVSPLTKADKLTYLLNDCRAVALIADGHLARVFVGAAARAPHLRTVVVTGTFDPARLEGLPGVVAWADALAGEPVHLPPPRRCLEVDLAAIIYTSGSTGDPKGVMLTHRNMLTAATSVLSYLETEEDDVILGVLPLAFDYGLYQVIMACAVGARLVLERGFAYPAQVLEVIVEEKVTGFPGLPTLFAVLAELDHAGAYDFSSIRYVTNTAAALPVRHIRVLREIFPNARIFSMYGLTECKRCTYLPPEDLDRKPTSVGIAIPNTELWLVGEDGEKLGPGEVGQLVIRGATVMKGYWEKPEATARKLRPGPIPGELVLYTGDLCRLDEEGYLYFVGRMDNIIKSRGEKVAPREVEDAIHAIAGVKECIVVGVDDPLLGQAVKAFVVPAAGATLAPREIILACQRRLSSFMVPKYVEILGELPTTNTGKTTIPPPKPA